MIVSVSVFLYVFGDYDRILRLAHKSSLFTVTVKAGGKRIVQKHTPTPAPEPPQKDEDEEEYVASR